MGVGFWRLGERLVSRLISLGEYVLICRLLGLLNQIDGALSIRIDKVDNGAKLRLALAL